MLEILRKFLNKAKKPIQENLEYNTFYILPVYLTVQL